MRHLLLILMLVLAPCLWADFSAEITGNIRSSRQGEKFAGVKVSLSIDPMKGQFDYRALANAEKRLGPLAEVSVTGSATTDAEGNFTLTAQFKKETAGNYLTTKKGRAQPANVVHVFVNIEKEGYLRDVHPARVVEGEATKLNSIFPILIPEVTGKLLYMANRKPAAGVEIQFAKFIAAGLQQPNRGVTVKTDAQGRFRFYEANGPHGNVVLSIVDSGLAFALSSSGRKAFNTSSGAVDMGNLMLVPGGGVKLKCVDDDTNEGIRLHGKIYPVDKNETPGFHRYQEIASAYTMDGTFHFSGLPEGDYRLVLEPGSYARFPEREFSIKGGEILDLGEFRFIPLKSQKFLITTESGDNVTHGYIYAEMMDESDVPADQSNGRRSGTNFSNGVAYLGGLRRGRWYVVAKSQGLASAWMELDLPTEAEPTFVLQKGGKVEVFKAGNQGGHFLYWLMIAVSGSPAAEVLSAHNREYKPDFDNNLLNKPVGLVHDQGYVSQNDTSDPLATGTYLVVGGAPGFGLFRQEVNVENGKTTRVEVKAQPCRLAVQVSDNGKAAGGAKLYYHVTDRWDAGRKEPQVQEFKCDASGRATLESEEGIRGFVLLQREHDWVMGTPQFKRSEVYRALSVRHVELSRGVSSDIVIESGGSEFCFLHIEAKLPKGGTLQSGTLVPRVQVTANLVEVNPNFVSSDTFNPTSQVQDGRLTFGMLRPGKYMLKAMVNLPEGSATVFQEIVVEQKGEQKLTIDAKLYKVTVSVKVPSDVDTDRVFVTLAPADPELASLGFHASYNKVKDDFVFACVGTGDYIVTATAAAPNGSMKAGTSVSVTRNTKAKVTLDDDVGAINVAIGNARSGLLPRHMSECTRMRVYDDKGKEVDPIDPREVFFRGRTDMTFNGLAPGTYTVKVQAHGMAEWVKDGVVVEAGNVTTLGAMLESSTVVRLTLEGVPVSSLGDVVIKFTDAAGKEVTPDAPDQRFVLVESSRDAAPVVHITNLRREMKKFTLKIKGYRAVTIEIDTDQGLTLAYSPKLEKE